MRLPPPVWIGPDPADDRVGGSICSSEGGTPQPRDGSARPARHAALHRPLHAEMEAPSRDRDGEQLVVVEGRGHDPEHEWRAPG